MTIFYYKRVSKKFCLPSQCKNIGKCSSCVFLPVIDLVAVSHMLSLLLEGFRLQREGISNKLRVLESIHVCEEKAFLTNGEFWNLFTSVDLWIQRSTANRQGSLLLNWFKIFFWHISNARSQNRNSHHLMETYIKS